MSTGLATVMAAVENSMSTKCGFDAGVTSRSGCSLLPIHATHAGFAAEPRDWNPFRGVPVWVIWCQGVQNIQAHAAAVQPVSACLATLVPGPRKPLRLGKAVSAESNRKRGSARVELKHNQMLLQTRPATNEQKKQAVLEEWYRSQLKQTAPPLIARWEPLMGVKVERFFVQKMKTIWGSCSRGSASIRLNTELAKKPRECLEYHEMVHLLEPTRNKRFIALMDDFIPNWRFYREVLNRLPVRHERWGY